MSRESMLTFQDAEQLLSYDPETGVFRRLQCLTKFQKQGEVAGCIHKRNGYLCISVKGMQFYGHRLAWLMSTGEWPLGVIDHINGIRSDNRIINLRDVSQQTNTLNRQKRTASFHKATGLWRARTSIKGVEMCSYYALKEKAEAHVATMQMQYRSDQHAFNRLDKVTA